MNADFFSTIFGKPGAQMSQEQFQGVYAQAADFQGHYFSQQQAGTIVTAEMENEMVIRRCGNICLAARDCRWKLQLQGGPRVYQAAFRHEDGRVVTGKAHTTKTGAVLLAAEQLETYGFLRD